MDKSNILICDASGMPHHWATWADTITLKVKDCISYEMGDPYEIMGGINRISGNRSKIDVGQIVFLKEILKYDTRVPPLTNENLFARDLGICGYCGRRFSKLKLSRDHIHPVSLGGKNIWTNVTTACKQCNHQKDNKMIGEAYDSDGKKMELLYLPYVPSHVERLILSNRKILASQMEFLQAMLPVNSRLNTYKTIYTM